MNQSDRPVVVKPETGPIGTVPAHHTYPEKIDGVQGSDGKWWKFAGKEWLPDNIVEVTAHGDVVCVGGLCKVIPPQQHDQDPDETWKTPENPKPLPGCRPNK